LEGSKTNNDGRTALIYTFTLFIYLSKEHIQSIAMPSQKQCNPANAPQLYWTKAIIRLAKINFRNMRRKKVFKTLRS